jgi:hypothetical protein
MLLSGLIGVMVGAVGTASYVLFKGLKLLKEEAK